MDGGRKGGRCGSERAERWVGRGIMLLDGRIDDGGYRLREAARPCPVRPFDGPHVWRIFVERKVRSRAVVVREIPGQDATQVLLAENDDMVEALASHRADEPFRERILPTTEPISGPLFQRALALTSRLP